MLGRLCVKGGKWNILFESVRPPLYWLFWVRFRLFDGALFIGRVTALEAVESELAGSRVKEMKVTFSVERYWKGVDGRTITIYTGAGGGDCGVSYSVGKRYFILAQRVYARLRTDICTSPKGLGDVKPYEKEFGRGMVPKRPK